MENGGPDNDPNYQMGVLNFIKDDNGNPQKMTVSMKYNDECVTAINANCSEDKIKTILTFIDYFYSEEARSSPTTVLRAKALRIPTVIGIYRRLSD